MLRIALVFPVFNGLSHTKTCLQSLFGSHKIEQYSNEIKVVLVNDGSTDDTTAWINENFPQVNLLTGTGNLWWSGGINLAIDHALDQLKSDYIIWWNNDIVAEKNYFSNLMTILNNHDGTTIIGSKIFHAHSKDTIWSMGGLFDPKTGYKSLIGSAEKDQEKYQHVTECNWLPGMGTITHKSVYERIGMLDEKNFPQYHGDSDFTFRAFKKGIRILVYPDLVIYNDTHHSGIRHGGSSKRLIQSMFSIKSNYNISKDFNFYKKHSESLSAYSVLFRKYYNYIGGFLKWKILGWFGIKKNGT
jgi:GT2 family glycosyltransferase